MEMAGKRGTRKRYTKRQFGLYMMIAPMVVLLFLFSYIPMYGIVIAFQDYFPFTGVSGSKWVGFKHFAYFLTDDTFYYVLKNTLIINFYDIVFGFTAPIVFAILANELMHQPFKRIIQSISYLPNFFSWVVVAGLMQLVLTSDKGGLVNDALHWLFGIGPISFLTDSKLFVPLVVVLDIWKSVGFSAILYFATITNIPSELYEAASIDGASRIRKMYHVTLPGLIPIIVLLFLLKLSTIFTIGFDRIFNLQNPMVYNVSEVISTYVYHVGLQQAQFSLTTAIGLAQSVIGFTLLILSNWLSKRFVGLGLY
ncbi:ABC transporter permease [Paenibacillus nasutitermitis]|uniref:Multiple-sugar transport system permease YteP n=1 Tax=Paenibacillus nasutitermitis TaxID=1652958 RepID=A0A917DWD2_9BACL|nr:ABC transporter permease subunit [Paenibacillus nasutitermitis]GGD72944.1 putative multiple-sugar transport system permease YteP [Paenibacillus nasutitermitis]